MCDKAHQKYVRKWHYRLCGYPKCRSFAEAFIKKWSIEPQGNLSECRVVIM
ncbi:hypothetical protein GTQ55_17375 [Microbulbifer hydrolyticus]|uniref:Uncharacterized protein n=1 Tax=Microbulbifer hydrolyticus TaxID=48074 RepID=A0ABX6J2R9_9GAMM|nr:hypothetical protein GTQ55_17375 [Microbulbifer hydrolyticus]